MKKILSLLTVLVFGLSTSWAQEVTFDFTANEWNHALGATLDPEPGNVDELVKDDVTLVFKQAKGTTHPRYWTGPQIRLYKSNVMKVMAPEGKAVTKVEFMVDGSYFNLDDVDGLDKTAKTWEGNATYAKFTGSGTSRLTQVVVTLADKDGSTVAAEEADEEIFLDFNDPTLHSEFDVVENTYLTEDIVLTDKADENSVVTTIPYIPGVANSSQNYIRISGMNVSLYLRGGKVTFKTHADKVFKNIKMVSAAFNATMNGEAVTKAQINGDGWGCNTNIVEMNVTSGTNITSITFVIADKAVEAEIPTAIETVVRSNADNAVFNLNGQRVAAPAKGLYIVNGKKIVK